MFTSLINSRFTYCFHKCKSGTTVCRKLPDTNKQNNFRVRQSNVFLNFKLSSRQTRNTPYWAMLLLLTLVINLRLPLFSITNVNGNYFRTRFHKYSESSCQMFSSKLRDLNYSILCNWFISTIEMYEIFYFLKAFIAISQRDKFRRWRIFDSIDL